MKVSRLNYDKTRKIAIFGNRDFIFLCNTAVYGISIAYRYMYSTD